MSAKITCKFPECVYLAAIDKIGGQGLFIPISFHGHGISKLIKHLLTSITYFVPYKVAP